MDDNRLHVEGLKGSGALETKNARSTLATRLLMSLRSDGITLVTLAGSS